MSAGGTPGSVASLWLQRRSSALTTRLARWQALRILRSMERSRPSPFATGPAEGYLRGIDFYGRQELLLTLENVLSTYRRSGGRFPDLMSPQLFSEKINHAKFFSPIKVPESGNKLLTASFLPPALRNRVGVPEIVWHSNEPKLPGNDTLAADVYYLKASHGSGMVRRIRFPLGAEERRELEATCRHWLSSPYGVALGEWWYNVFPRRILIEKSVAARSPSIVLLFYVVGGDVAYISVDEKSLEPGFPTRCLRLDGNFHPLTRQKRDRERLWEFHLSDAHRSDCLEVACAIGRQFRSVRIDLILGDDDRIYLNEITLSSNAGLPFQDSELDRHLGSLWPGTGLFAP
jgi:hypothetical protein